MAVAAQVSTFDWGQFISVAAPVVFTTFMSVLSYFTGHAHGQANADGKPDHASALDTAVSTISLAVQAAQAVGQVIGAVQAAQKPQEPAPVPAVAAAPALPATNPGAVIP